MKIYELHCRCKNHGSYEDQHEYDMAINFYATKELAESAAKDLDALKASKFEYPKLVKEYTKQDLDKVNARAHYDGDISDMPLCHNYIRAVQILDAYSERYQDLEVPWNLWDFYYEIIEHELIGG